MEAERYSGVGGAANRPRPRILVALEPLEVRLFASDLWEQRRLEQLADLVRVVLSEAVRRPTGTA